MTDGTQAPKRALRRFPLLAVMLLGVVIAVTGLWLATESIASLIPGRDEDQQVCYAPDAQGHEKKYTGAACDDYRRESELRP